MIIQVSSHRRSGTHALIDFIRANFFIHGTFFHLEDIIDWPIDKLETLHVIVKTHEPAPLSKLNRFAKQGLISPGKAHQLNQITTNVHVYRNPKEVLRSLYYFNIKGHEPIYQIPEEMQFIEYLQQEGVQDASPGENRIQFWQRCVKNWTTSEGVLSCCYNTIVENKSLLKERLAEHLGIPTREQANSRHESTAIGRDTTRRMASKDVWDASCDQLFSQQIDPRVLESLELEV